MPGVRDQTTCACMPSSVAGVATQMLPSLAECGAAIHHDHTPAEHTQHTHTCTHARTRTHTHNRCGHGHGRRHRPGLAWPTSSTLVNEACAHIHLSTTHPPTFLLKRCKSPAKRSCVTVQNVLGHACNSGCSHLSNTNDTSSWAGLWARSNTDFRSGRFKNPHSAAVTVGTRLGCHAIALPPPSADAEVLGAAPP